MKKNIIFGIVLVCLITSIIALQIIYFDNKTDPFDSSVINRTDINSVHTGGWNSRGHPYEACWNTTFNNSGTLTINFVTDYSPGKVWPYASIRIRDANKNLLEELNDTDRDFKVVSKYNYFAGTPIGICLRVFNSSGATLYYDSMASYYGYEGSISYAPWIYGTILNARELNITIPKDANITSASFTISNNTIFPDPIPDSQTTTNAHSPLNVLRHAMRKYVCGNVTGMAFTLSKRTGAGNYSGNYSYKIRKVSDNSILAQVDMGLVDNLEDSLYGGYYHEGNITPSVFICDDVYLTIELEYNENSSIVLNSGIPSSGYSTAYYPWNYSNGIYRGYRYNGTAWIDSNFGTWIPTYYVFYEKSKVSDFNIYLFGNNLFNSSGIFSQTTQVNNFASLLNSVYNVSGTPKYNNKTILQSSFENDTTNWTLDTSSLSTAWSSVGNYSIYLPDCVASSIYTTQLINFSETGNEYLYFDYKNNGFLTGKEWEICTQVGGPYSCVPTQQDQNCNQGITNKTLDLSYVTGMKYLAIVGCSVCGFNYTLSDMYIDNIRLYGPDPNNISSYTVPLLFFSSSEGGFNISNLNIEYNLTQSNITNQTNQTNITLTINAPSGTYNAITGVPITINATVLGLGTLDTCIYNVTQRPNVSIIDTPNTRIANLSNAYLNVSGFGNYIFNLWCNDTTGTSKTASSNFSVINNPGGGGSQAPAPVDFNSVIGVTEPNAGNWSMATDGNTNNYDIQMTSDSSRTKQLQFENFGESTRTLTLTCEDVQGSLCQLVDYPKSFVLPVLQGIKTIKTATLDIPDTIPNGEYKFNIYAQDEYGHKQAITFTTTVGNFGLLTGFAIKLGSSANLNGFNVPYLLIGLFVAALFFIGTYFLLRKNKLGSSIAFIVGLIALIITVTIL